MINTMSDHYLEESKNIDDSSKQEASVFVTTYVDLESRYFEQD